MDKKKIEELLNSINPPKIEPGKHKENLRRDLLTSNIYEKNNISLVKLKLNLKFWTLKPNIYRI